MADAPVYTPKCGHHGTVLIDLGDPHGYRCPHCFPRMFPPCGDVFDTLGRLAQRVTCVAPRGHERGPEGSPHRAEIIWPAKETLEPDLR